MLAPRRVLWRGGEGREETGVKKGREGDLKRNMRKGVQEGRGGGEEREECRDWRKRREGEEEERSW